MSFNSNSTPISKDSWIPSNQNIIDYGHHSTYSGVPSSAQPSMCFAPIPSFNALQPGKVHSSFLDSFDKNIQKQLTNLSSNQQKTKPWVSAGSYRGTAKQSQKSSTYHPSQLFSSSVKDPSNTKEYDPFVQDKINKMDISDDEKQTQETPEIVDLTDELPEKHSSIRGNVDVKSGSSFYKGLILYIPPFTQIANTIRSSPAMKMLYASFEFSFKLPIRIETKPKETEPKVMDATVLFKDNVIATGSGVAPHIEASVRALELLSETCYTIQAKESYFEKCKLMDAETMKTLNLKKWEAVCQKYPKLLEITKESHIQKTFALFLDSHTSSGVYEDIVCCNLTRQDVNNIKSVAEFFQLTMLPCAVSTNMSKKHTPCVVSIHKYNSAKKLLEILIECGGENDKFRLFPPDSFKEFYKLHQSYWNPAFCSSKAKCNEDTKTTLDDEELQSLIIKPYENTITNLFEKHKTLPKIKRPDEVNCYRKAGDDFMMKNLKIDMTHNKNVAPVERMQLLLKYMEQLQEYGSRVLTSGRPEMIKIYHNAIDNLRKDLDTCRKDIEKDQNEKSIAVIKANEKQVNMSRSLPSRKRSPHRRRSKSPIRKSSKIRARSPNRKSWSPKRQSKLRRSLSPRKRTRSPGRIRGPSRALPPSRRQSPPPRRQSPPPRQQAPSPWLANSTRPTLTSQPLEDVSCSIFKDQFRRYVDNLRRFRVEVEDTPIERRSLLKERFLRYSEQLNKFLSEVRKNPKELDSYFDEIHVCKDELKEQSDLIGGKPGPNDLPQSITPPQSIDVPSWAQNTFMPSMSTAYPLPDPMRRFPSVVPPPPPVFNPPSSPFTPGYRYNY